ncbi:MAG: carbonic anhydrase [marine bacterium B5-7]|nr:MAG: carbonic anhydrase [marine bacterium B5-7]
MKAKPIVLIGAGGHAKVLYELLQLNARVVSSITCKQRSDMDTFFSALSYVEDQRLAEQCPADEYDLAIGVGSVLPHPTRIALYQQFKAAGYTIVGGIHPSATVNQFAEVSPSAQVMAGAIIQASAKIADNVIINTAATVDHDTQISAHVHISPGVTVCGGVSIEEGAHIGAGAILLQGVCIGAGSLIAAGAVVVGNVPANTKVKGLPAREFA